MTLKVVSEGVSKVKTNGDYLEISQTGLKAYKVKTGKIIIHPDYIFCDTYVFRKNTYIPLFNCYFKGNGTATINLQNKNHTLSGISQGSEKFTDYVASIVKVLQAPGVSSTHFWSACKSSTTDGTTLNTEQTACLNFQNFSTNSYNLNRAAPTIVVTKTQMSNSPGSPIGIGYQNLIYTIKQSGVTSNVYYSVGVQLTWAS